MGAFLFLFTWLPGRNRAFCDVGRDCLSVPQIGELQSPGAMGICLVHFDNDALQVLGPLVNLVKGNLNVLLFQLFLVNDGDSSVDSDNIVDAGDEE